MHPEGYAGELITVTTTKIEAIYLAFFLTLPGSGKCVRFTCHSSSDLAGVKMQGLPPVFCYIE